MRRLESRIGHHRVENGVAPTTKHARSSAASHTARRTRPSGRTTRQGGAPRRRRVHDRCAGAGRLHPGGARRGCPDVEQCGHLIVPRLARMVTLLRSRDTRTRGGVDLSLQHPPPQRLHTNAGLRADRLAGGIHRPVLTNVIAHHLHRTLTLLDRVMLRHNQHPSHRRRRHQTRDGSRVRGASVPASEEMKRCVRQTRPPSP